MQLDENVKDKTILRRLIYDDDMKHVTFEYT